eukprot:TRINITY_DN4974_c0_g1_i1.p1 TRINITY_DN4974_c0_g1~~TRINITY_DN4974_c0_g1_i1.p1  ORF type:complete len:352 (+),score=67.46 TRINITY_DN4974_c0_g1_i1:102-1157(+)
MSQSSSDPDDQYSYFERDGDNLEPEYKGGTDPEAQLDAESEDPSWRVTNQDGVPSAGVIFPSGEYDAMFYWLPTLPSAHVDRDGNETLDLFPESQAASPRDESSSASSSSGTDNYVMANERSKRKRSQHDAAAVVAEDPALTAPDSKRRKTTLDPPNPAKNSKLSSKWKASAASKPKKKVSSDPNSVKVKKARPPNLHAFHTKVECKFSLPYMFLSPADGWTPNLFRERLPDVSTRVFHVVHRDACPEVIDLGNEMHPCGKETKRYIHDRPIHDLVVDSKSQSVSGVVVCRCPCSDRTQSGSDSRVYIFFYNGKPFAATAAVRLVVKRVKTDMDNFRPSEPSFLNPTVFNG